MELATVSFGQSFQITPIQLATTVSSLINGGRRITPHFGVAVLSADGTRGREAGISGGRRALSLKKLQGNKRNPGNSSIRGSGKNADRRICSRGKTATSQTLPRSANRYISSFLGLCPAEDPQILGLCIIHDPQGVYYGGTLLHL